MVAVPMGLAFLIEISLYLGVRQLAAFPPLAVAATAVVPYGIYAAATGKFALWQASLLALLVLMACTMLQLSPKAGLDVVFLVFMGAVYLAKPFRAIYMDPVESLRVDTLGQLMWIRVGVAAFLRNRPGLETGLGFWPSRKEWETGAKFFLYFVPFGLGLAALLGYPQFGLDANWWWKAPATFAGIFFVVALAEEFFFRGVLQRRLTQWTTPLTGLCVASVAFGLVHLPFRGFPNWRHVILATVLGLFLGKAFQTAGGIRAAMVAHALVVALWQVVFL